MDKSKDQGFETSLASLERIVGQLESGDLPLERALKLFEEGVGLARHCQSQLDEAERKVELLLRERGEIKAIPFDSSNDAGTTEEAASPKPLFNSPSAKVAAARAEERASDLKSDDSIPF